MATQAWVTGKQKTQRPQAIKYGGDHKDSRNSSITEDSLENGARVQQESSIVPSLTPPPQTAPQWNKECCPTMAKA